jgi:hypothetical protein
MRSKTPFSGEGFPLKLPKQLSWEVFSPSNWPSSFLGRVSSPSKCPSSFLVRFFPVKLPKQFDREGFFPLKLLFSGGFLPYQTAQSVFW